MEFLFVIFSFVLGTIIGSFLNVVALRYGTKKNLGGRSSCMSCKHTLSWYELLPVVSFLFLRGKCRSCKSNISWQYPLVEFATGVLFAGAFIKYLPLLDTDPFTFASIFTFVAVVISLLVVIVVYDMRHKIIPDGLVFTFIALSFARLIVDWGFAGIFSVPGIIDLLVGPLVAIPFALLWLVSGGKWIGLGDAKLMLGIGWFLGIPAVSAVALGFWIGALYAVGLLFVSKKGTVRRNTEIPFAPFLILGFFIVFFWKCDFFYLKDILLYVF